MFVATVAVAARAAGADGGAGLAVAGVVGVVGVTAGCVVVDLGVALAREAGSGDVAVVNGDAGAGAGAAGRTGAKAAASWVGTTAAGPVGVAETTCLPPLKARMKATMSFTSV